MSSIDENTALSYLDRGGVFVNSTLLCGCCAERVNIALTWWSRLGSNQRPLGERDALPLSHGTVSDALRLARGRRLHVHVMNPKSGP